MLLNLNSLLHGAKNEHYVSKVVPILARSNRACLSHEPADQQERQAAAGQPMHG